MASKPPNFANEKLLPVGEWFAENAYISPGSHRLYTALGLMSGLFAGRMVMNVLTGKDYMGNPQPLEQAPPPLQPFHGILAYNRYDDSADAKWHKILNAMVPMFFGAVGAMAGSAHFSHGAALTKGLAADLAKGSEGFYLQHADMLANKEQARVLNGLSSIGLNTGSTSGVHLFPTPVSAATSAFRFQIDNGKNIILPGLRGITGNRGHSSRNLYTALKEFISWAENNAAHYTNQEWYRKNNAPFQHAKDMLQLFKNATPEQQKELEGVIERLAIKLDGIAAAEAKRTGKKGNALVAELAKADSPFRKELNEFTTKGLEKTFIKQGLIDPKNPVHEDILLGDHGVITQTIGWLGGKKAIGEFKQEWGKAVQHRHGTSTAAPAKNLEAILPDYGIASTALYYMGALGLTGAMVGLARTTKPLPEPPTADAKPDVSGMTKAQAARTIHAWETEHKPHGLMNAINGKPLDFLSFVSDVLVVPPGLHRFMNAATLTAFLYTGAKFSSALAAREIRGAALTQDQVWSVFKPFYGKMDYVWKSGETADRWKYVVHQMIPVAVGALGTYTGSRLFFQKRIDEVNKAEYLEDYTDAVSMHQSEPYAIATGITSILNTGSGFHMLPFISYGSNLQNRFMMANGQQIATPILGQWWSGNPSMYPYHVKRLLNYMVNYTTNNTSEYPQQFEDLAHALIAKIYPNLPEQEMKAKEEALVNKLYEWREPFWKEGGVPADQKEACKKALESHLRKEGLEQTLLELGLDPLKAKLDHNGASITIARAFGAANQIDRDIQDYRAKAAKRIETYQSAPPKTTIPKPSDGTVVSQVEPRVHQVGA